jgi:hypothetical protein
VVVRCGLVLGVELADAGIMGKRSSGSISRFDTYRR